MTPRCWSIISCANCNSRFWILEYKTVFCTDGAVPAWHIWLPHLRWGVPGQLQGRQLEPLFTDVSPPNRYISEHKGQWPVRDVSPKPLKLTLLECWSPSAIIPPESIPLFQLSQPFPCWSSFDLPRSHQLHFRVGLLICPTKPIHPTSQLGK